MKTPEQSKDLWCPMARVAQIGTKPVGLTDFAGIAAGSLAQLAARLHSKATLALAA